MSYDKRFKVTLLAKKQPCEGRSLPSSSAWLSSCRAATNVHILHASYHNVWDRAYSSMLAITLISSSLVFLLQWQALFSERNGPSNYTLQWPSPHTFPEWGPSID